MDTDRACTKTTMSPILMQDACIFIGRHIEDWSILSETMHQIPLTFFSPLAMIVVRYLICLM